MRTNRTKPESERGWLGCRLRGGLVVGALLFSGVGARGYLVTSPIETPVVDDYGPDDGAAPDPLLGLRLWFEQAVPGPCSPTNLAILLELSRRAGTNRNDRHTTRTTPEENGR